MIILGLKGSETRYVFAAREKLCSNELLLFGEENVQDSSYAGKSPPMYRRTTKGVGILGRRGRESPKED